MAESKVIAVHGDGTYNSPHGMLYKFQYAFEDGTTISANHKTQEPRFKPGDIAAYDVKGSRDGHAYGTVQRAENTAYSNAPRSAGSSQYTDKDERIGRQWAINAAMSYIGMTQDVPTVGDVANVARELLKMRDSLEEYTGNTEDLPF